MLPLLFQGFLASVSRRWARTKSGGDSSQKITALLFQLWNTSETSALWFATPLIILGWWGGESVGIGLKKPGITSPHTGEKDGIAS